MRCPKCGFISFDHLEECLKCKKNIKATSDSLRGAAFMVQPPQFLRLQGRQEEDEVFEEQAETGVSTHDEVFDEDLEVLMEGDAEEAVPAGPPPVAAPSRLAVAEEVEPAERDEEEDGEIEIDLSQFEDAQEEEEFKPAPVTKLPPLEAEAADAAEEDDFAISLEVPEELADLSDLTPPAKVEAAKPVAQKSEMKAGPPSQPADLGLDLDFDLDLDLGFDELATSPASKTTESKETVLALDDIDFSETLSKDPVKPKEKKPVGKMDMDADLNFELDLGGLSIHKDF